MNRGGRIAGGCLLVAVGSTVAFVAFLWSGLEEFYGSDRSSVQLVLNVVLLGGVAVVGWGVVLISGHRAEREQA